MTFNQILILGWITSLVICLIESARTYANEGDWLVWVVVLATAPVMAPLIVGEWIAKSQRARR